MELHLLRQDSVTRGMLYLGATLFCYTLERPPDDPEHPRIAAGTYRVVVTPSERATAGALWSPREDHGLPLLVDVPGRSRIRIHAGNVVTDGIGCILVGTDRAASKTGTPVLVHSRVALTTLLARMSSPCFITVKDPKEN